MFKKKLFVAALGLGLLFFGNTLQASAAVKGNPDDLKIDAKSNTEAIAIIKSQGDLDVSPVPAENLTTQQPIESKFPLQTRLAGKYQGLNLYRVDGSAFVDGMWQIRCNYLVPVGFSWLDNGIPSSVPVHISNSTFVFNDNIADTGIGGYGTGGYYWRRFVSHIHGRGNVFYWLSTWNLNHLRYG